MLIWVRSLQVLCLMSGLGSVGWVGDVVGMVLPQPHGDLSLSLDILSKGESPGVEGLGFPKERASLWLYIHFAGHHHHEAEHRHQ